MADLSFTASAVKTVTGTYTTQKSTQYLAGEAMTAGMMCYLKDDGKLWKADSSNTTKSNFFGMVLNQAVAADQYVLVATSGDVTVGSILTAGEFYFVSGTAGGVQPSADVGSGEYKVMIGFATSATNFRISKVNTGVAIA